LVATKGKSHVPTFGDPRLRVWRNQALVEPRVLYSISEASPTFELGVNNADISTLTTALLERMYYCKVNGEFVAPPEVNNSTFVSRLDYFSKAVSKKVGHAAPVSLNKVVEMYEGRKRVIYGNARDRYETTGWNEKYPWLKAFVKMEKVNPEKAPRCIQPRDPVYNVRLASYIKPIEKRIYRAIDKIFGDGPTVIKGYNVERIGSIMRGKWKTFDKPVAIGLDAVKFDMHVSKEALEWEHSVYDNIYRCKILRSLLKSQVYQRGGARCKDGHLSYKVVGRRASGDMNTGLGNCLLMCALVHAYAKSKDIPIKLMNNGDDCAVMMEKQYEKEFMESLNAWFLEMGFRMTAEKPVYTLPEIEFCQMRAIEYGEGKITMVRNIPVALRKDSLITIDVSKPNVLKAWMNAVGTGGLALTGGIPIMQNFYRRLMILSEGRDSKIATELARNSGMHLLSIGMHKKFVEPTAEARLNVYLAWGITPDEQEALEAYYDSYVIEFASPVGVDRHSNHNILFNVLSR